ncbi:MAG: hypothetical protein WDO13_15370 [Verrucomicrobiota bacterium]
MIREIGEDRLRLEQFCGYPVRGMSYPFGVFNREILALLPSLGIRYSRTVNATGGFGLPEDFSPGIRRFITARVCWKRRSSS